MARPSQQDIVVALLARHGTTYAREAGVARGLPDDSRRLAKLAGGPAETARLATALVRVELAGDHDEVLATAGGS
ncbi:MAG: hypothetical protein MSC31_02770 [Solirubrobacteraceae bacterium MAG38_C4-C5]|nr:hypothetical protein [Candidatus Siliceabacter maunaloa]